MAHSIASAKRPAKRDRIRPASARSRSCSRTRSRASALARSAVARYSVTRETLALLAGAERAV